MNEGFRYQVCTHAKLSRWIVAAKRQKILMYIKGVKIKQRFRNFTNIYLCILWFDFYIYSTAKSRDTGSSLLFKLYLSVSYR